MRWDILARGGLRYTLPAGGVAGVLTYGFGGFFGILFLLLGVLTVTFTLVGSSGTGTAATTIEPASGVNIDPREYATKPIGSKNVRVFFLAVGVVLGTITGMVFP